MSDARKRAEKALETLMVWDEPYRPRTVEIDARDLREILAEEPPVGQLVEGEPGHESCVGCGRPVAPSEDQVREFAYYLGGDRAVAAIEAVPTPSPLPPEVREALLAEVPPMSAATPGGFHTRAKEWLARRDTVGHLAETPEVGIIRALLADNDVAAKRVPCGDPDCLCGISPEVHAPQKGVPE